MDYRQNSEIKSKERERERERGRERERDKAEILERYGSPHGFIPRHNLGSEEHRKAAKMKNYKILRMVPDSA